MSTFPHKTSRRKRRSYRQIYVQVRMHAASSWSKGT
jgi:hypothetical protein